MTTATWMRLAFVLGGVACAAVGVLLPPTAAFAFPAAGILIGVATPLPFGGTPKPATPSKP